MTSVARGPLYRRHRFPADVIAHAIWLYFHFPVSLHMVEDMLATRGIGQLMPMDSLPFGGKSVTSRRLRFDGSQIHPFRIDAWPRIVNMQTAALRKWLVDNVAPEKVEASFERLLKGDDALRDPADTAIISLLMLVRKNPLLNEGCIFDMSRLADDLAATTSATVDLSLVRVHSHSV